MVKGFEILGSVLIEKRRNSAEQGKERRGLTCEEDEHIRLELGEESCMCILVVLQA